MNVLGVIMIFISLVVAFYLGVLSFIKRLRKHCPATYLMLLNEIKLKKKIMEEKDHENA